MRTYLVGPVTADWARRYWAGPRERGACRAFNAEGDLDLTIRHGDTWDDVRARLPAEWRPDGIVLDLAYTCVPPCLWQADVPVVVLAPDWNLLWHTLGAVLPCADLVLTDAPGVAALRRRGYDHARPANLYGPERAYLGVPLPESKRDIDIIFIGNFHAAAQRERLAWLGRLARLGQRWHVVLRTHVYDDAYRDLLRRARIIFNRSNRGECNRRVFEAACCGALLFQEAGNAETPAYLRDRQECVYYTEDDLELLLEHYLTHEDERRALAAAAYARVQGYGFGDLWAETLDRLAAEWPALVERAQARPRLADEAALVARTWQALGCAHGGDPRLVADLQAAVAAQPSATLHNALGLAVAVAGRQYHRTDTDVLRQAAGCFQQAVAANPRHAVAALNLVETLFALGVYRLAAEGARRVLALLDRTAALAPAVLQAPHFPPGFDIFRVEWERAGWEHAGRPTAEVRARETLLRWRLHTLLAQLTGDLVAYHQAALARPDLPATQAALGCALGRAGRSAEALPHLRRAVADNPFDVPAARGLFQALVDAGDSEGQRDLAAQYRLLARAAPQLIQPEDWFAGTPATPSGGSATAAGALRLVWEGPLLAVHSLGLVNRKLCLGLLARGHELSLLPADHAETGAETSAEVSPLLQRIGQPLSGPVDGHVRLQWPPKWEPPPAGHWVLLQPWEHGSLPRAWLDPITRLVDEVWVPSRFVRDAFVQSGVPEHLVRVMPLGVDTGRCHPEAAPYPLQTKKRYKFLFVGGTLHRKGIDLLLQAYTRTFTRADDVCLVIKDMGVGTFYRGQTAHEEIARLQAEVNAPEIEYLSGTLSETELAGLYTACDCLVHPYRGEGFGLPLAEAMACGRPVIVTGQGAALDFCDESRAFLLPARRLRATEKRLGDLETVDYPWLAEPELDALCDRLRFVVAHPEEARARGKAACAHVRQHLTWKHAVSAVETRLRELRHQPIRRPQQTHTASVVVSGPPNGRPRISLCLIVKNEEANLPDCLRSAADLVDEVIVVDTGSTDRTKEIAASFGAKVFDFPWVDHFAAARNESLRHATGDWIFWLDADDRLDTENRQHLRELFARLRPENVAYAMKCLCLAEHDTGAATLVDHVRLFPRHERIRWRYRIHEQILPAIRDGGGQVRFTDVVIRHTGYQDPALRVRKRERDLRLLQMEDAEHPDDPFTLFNLGSVYHELGRDREALPLLRRSLERSDVTASIVRKLYSLIANCHRALGEVPQALAACTQGRKHYPDDLELLFTEGVLREQAGDLPGAAACLEQALATKPGQHFASIDAGLRGYKARLILGAIYRRQGRLDEAAAQFRQTLAERPDFLPGWVELGEVAVRRGDAGAVEAAARRMEGLPGGAWEARLLRARWALARQEFALARTLLQEAIAAEPRALAPRVLLSHTFLQEGKDRTGAEQALRDVLALAPDHAAARQNLAVLVRHGTGFGSLNGSPRIRLAVICIVHNEEDFIVPFLEHYLGQGASAVVVVNNDCSDRTLELARRYSHVTVTDLDSGDALDDVLRTATFQQQRQACAGRFDYVILADGDEFLVAREGGTLQEALARHQGPEVLGCAGWQVVQRPDDPPLALTRPLLPQRGWGFPDRRYDKPVVLRPAGAARLAPGQHYLAGRAPYPAVCPFYLLHLAGADERLFLKRRLQMTARQGLANLQRGLSTEHTCQSEADIRRRFRAMQQHPQMQPLPVGRSAATATVA